MVDYYLDITAEVCPLTFVKVKLLIERMRPGQIAEVQLASGDALTNVPRAVREHGYRILSLEPLMPRSSFYRLRLQKRM